MKYRGTLIKHEDGVSVSCPALRGCHSQGKTREVGEAPAAGGQLKFITDRHWSITHFDPKTGVVIFHHGGTYALKGNEYSETAEYANPSTSNLIGKTFKFTIKTEGDTLTLIGIRNPWEEVWKRAK